MLEEAGVHIRPEDLVYKLTVHRQAASDTRIDVWFEAIAWAGEPINGEPTKHAAITWLSTEELPENIVDYIAFGIDNIAAGNSYGEFGWQE